MRKLIFLKVVTSIVLIFILITILAPQVFAAPSWWPLVPCGRQVPPGFTGPIAPGSTYAPCTRCDLFRLADNVIHFTLEGLIPPVAAVLFIAAGLMIVLAGANQSMYAKGIAIFKNTFWGLVIIFASWLIVNTFIQSFGPIQAQGGSWFRFTCEGGVIIPSVPPGPRLCSDPAGLAAENNTAYPEQNAPELNQLISCIQRNLPGENLGSISTYDVNDSKAPNSRLCNFTRGKKICGDCSHEINSCHYGGSSGSQGALAVDFGNEDIGDRMIGAAVLQCGAKNGRCEDSKGNFVSCLSSRATHVHINSRSCDRN